MKSINRILCVLGIAVMSFFVSCSPSDEDMIVGKWKCIRAEGSINAVTENTDVIFYEFTEGGRVMMFDGSQLAGIAKYKVSDGILSITMGEEVIKSEIAIITQKAMKLRRHVSIMGMDIDTEVDYRKL